jgi:hypothetical protein
VGVVMTVGRVVIEVAVAAAPAFSWETQPSERMSKNSRIKTSLIFITTDSSAVGNIFRKPQGTATAPHRISALESVIGGITH